MSVWVHVWWLGWSRCHSVRTLKMTAVDSPMIKWSTRGTAMFCSGVSCPEELLQGLALTQLTTLNCIDHPYPIIEIAPGMMKCQMLRNLAFSIGKLAKSSITPTFISILPFRASTR